MKGTIPKYYVRTYEYVNWIRTLFIYEFDNIEQREFLLLDEPLILDKDLEKMFLKPQKKSYLHKFIDEALSLSFDYESSKYAEPDEWNKLTSSFLNFEIDIDKYYSDEEGDDYKEELEKRIIDEVLPLIVEEVFSILFYDKEFLFYFNQFLADKLREVDRKMHPKLFRPNGQIYRVEYWPKWLERGVFYRERGRCSYCFKDVSGTLNLENKINLDHMIPLGAGGTNDTSNIQLLCEKCNKQKNKEVIKLKEHRYFKIY